MISLQNLLVPLLGDDYDTLMTSRMESHPPIALPRRCASRYQLLRIQDEAA